ncbi:hypothetical protein COO60DRAFT_83730 [Scenedesmus sp. NREL 46B-D3]|nr:hypothetical protein COO60DRAFT_83730 [Scenedesmus sp. NREL 46B-D3]
MLDEAHPPYRMRLPFCDKYKCSCCNASHALAIQRSVQHLLLDEELGLSCKAGLVMLACRLCDPQVGVGNVTSVCQSTCDSVYEACSEDYFAFDESSGDITPCTSQLSSSLVCSQLQQIAPGGEEFCRAADACWRCRCCSGFALQATEHHNPAAAAAAATAWITPHALTAALWQQTSAAQKPHCRSSGAAAQQAAAAAAAELNGDRKGQAAAAAQVFGRFVNSSGGTSGCWQK